MSNSPRNVKMIPAIDCGSVICAPVSPLFHIIIPMNEPHHTKEEIWNSLFEAANIYSGPKTTETALRIKSVKTSRDLCKSLGKFNRLCQKNLPKN